CAVFQHEDFTGAKVAIDIGTERQAPLITPIDVTSNDRAAARLAGIDVLRNRWNESCGGAGRRTKIRTASSFKDAPAIIAAARHDVDLLACVLPHITNVKGARLAIE